MPSDVLSVTCLKVEQMNKTVKSCHRLKKVELMKKTSHFMSRAVSLKTPTKNTYVHVD